VPVLAAPGWVGRVTGSNQTIVAVLTALIVTVPLGALDRLLAAVFATFGRARTIFLRRYVLAPSLQLAVVVLFVIRHASLIALAYGFVLGEVVGLVLYAAALRRLFREAGLLTHFSLRRIRMPVRDLFAFSIPLATGDWLAAFVQSSGVLVLAYVYSTHDVALLRAVLPVALLNESVLLSFALLFVPAASRLFACGDFEGLNLFYWRTSVWIAVLSFPVFAATFALATPLSVLFFGSRYAASGHLLHVLALGIYLQGTLGFNGNMLKVAGFVRSLMFINLAALAINAALILLLVPRYGAIGAAWAMTGTLVVHNVLKQVGLLGVPGLRAADARFALPFIVLLGAVLALALLRWAAPHSLFILLPGACAITLVVVILTRRNLQIGDVFPELRRLAILRPLLA
jgi:O-antigen/teichoic acid export membrane protein